MTSRAEAFSGHESFPCRYGWMPKLYEALVADPTLFADDERAMVALGLGKNMVRSIRFWGEAFGFLATAGRSVAPTNLAHRMLDPATGSDPYLEDPSSLWRLHWVASSRANLGAWNVALREVRDGEVTRQRLIDLVHARAIQARPGATPNTAAAHVEVFLRTYDGTRRAATAVVEDTLASPFQELSLLHVAEQGATQVVRFRRGPKPGLDLAALAFAVRDYWGTEAHGGRALTFRSVMLDERAPGAAFRLDEATAHDLLSEICDASDGALEMREDGVGGIDLVCRRGEPLAILEEMAWS